MTTTDPSQTATTNQPTTSSNPSDSTSQASSSPSNSTSQATPSPSDTTPAPIVTSDQLTALVGQFETDLSTYAAAQTKAAASAAQAASDATALAAARQTAHTDATNLAQTVAQLDPGTPAIPAALAAFRKYGSIVGGDHR